MRALTKMGAGASINEADQKSLTDELAKPVDASDVATPRGETARAEVVRLRAMLPGLAKPIGEAGATAAAGEAVAGEGAAAAAPAAGGPAVKYVCGETCTDLSCVARGLYGTST